MATFSGKASATHMNHSCINLISTSASMPPPLRCDQNVSAGSNSGLFPDFTKVLARKRVKQRRLECPRLRCRPLVWSLLIRGQSSGAGCRTASSFTRGTGMAEQISEPRNQLYQSEWWARSAAISEKRDRPISVEPLPVKKQQSNFSKTLASLFSAGPERGLISIFVKSN